MSDWINVALEVMKQVMRHPISQVFEKGIEDEEFEFEEESVGLIDIVGRLERKEYKIPYEWHKDMENVSRIAIDYYTDASFEAICARELRRLFNKGTCKKSLISVFDDFWCREMRG